MVDLSAYQPLSPAPSGPPATADSSANSAAVPLGSGITGALVVGIVGAVAWASSPTRRGASGVVAIWATNALLTFVLWKYPRKDFPS